MKDEGRDRGRDRSYHSSLSFSLARLMGVREGRDMGHGPRSAPCGEVLQEDAADERGAESINKGVSVGRSDKHAAKIIPQKIYSWVNKQ